MILPTKHISARHSLVGVGGLIVNELGEPKTVSALWDRMRRGRKVRTFQRFVLALDFLFAIGVVEYSGGLIRKVAG